MPRPSPWPKGRGVNSFAGASANLAQLASDEAGCLTFGARPGSCVIPAAGPERLPRDGYECL